MTDGIGVLLCSNGSMWTLAKNRKAITGNENKVIDHIKCRLSCVDFIAV